MDNVDPRIEWCDAELKRWEKDRDDDRKFYRFMRKMEWLAVVITLVCVGIAAWVISKI